MVVPQYPYPVLGGLEKQAHELSLTLGKLGSDVKVISGKTDTGQRAHEFVEGVSVYRFTWYSKKWMRFLLTPFRLGYLVLKLRHEYDVVHLHQYSWLSFFVLMLAGLCGKPSMMKLPNGSGRLGLSLITNSFFGPIKLRIFKRCEALVAITMGSFEELNTVGYPQERVLFCPNGIRIREDNVKQGKTNAYCRVVFVGALLDEKGVRDLLYAWRDVQNQVSQRSVLELWGAGVLQSHYEDLCKELGIEDSVQFCGMVDGVPGKLKEMDIFVLPSVSEGNSNAILEAMAAGLPVVSTKVGGTPMQVGTEGERFLVTPGDRDALKECISGLINDEATRLQLGKAMLQRARSQFDINVVAQTYQTAYEFLFSGQSNLMSQVNDIAAFLPSSDTST